MPFSLIGGVHKDCKLVTLVVGTSRRQIALLCMLHLESDSTGFGLTPDIYANA